jgi:hypothetical protein
MGHWATIDSQQPSFVANKGGTLARWWGQIDGSPLLFKLQACNFFASAQVEAVTDQRRVRKDTWVVREDAHAQNQPILVAACVEQ